MLIEDAFYESFAEGDENLIVQALKFLVEKVGTVASELIIEKIGDWLIGVLNRVAEQNNQDNQAGQDARWLMENLNH